MTSLSDLGTGDRGLIEHVGGERTFRRRLMELGLVPGTTVEVLGVAPLGDPLKLLVRDCILSVRRGDAAQIVLGAVHRPALARALVAVDPMRSAS
jgi:ferrous iron transport protein A